MIVARAHRIALNPNNVQATYFAKAAGVARHAYNWGLARWKTEYAAGNKPTAFSIKKLYRAEQDSFAPWAREVTKCAPEGAMADLGKAFNNFFGKRARYPSFHKKGNDDGFYISNDQLRIEGRKIRIPKLGWVRMYEELRFEGKILGATVKRQASRWFVSVQVETDLPVREPSTRATGIDLGVNRLATLADGTAEVGPKPHRSVLLRLRKLNKELSRRQKGGKNRAKTKEKLASIHYRISNIRRDAMHKLTSGLVANYGFIGIEDLNVSGMVRNKNLARSISDQSFGMFRSMLEYKAKSAGVWVQPIGRFFPSTKMCSACGQIHDMPMNVRTMKCECGNHMDRDENAARNILAEAKRTAGLAGVACCHGSSDAAKAA